MGNKRLSIIAAAVALGLMCVHGEIKSNASALKAKDTKSNQTVTINEARVPGSNVATAAENLPSEVDNSQTKYFPPIINQGTVESCASWALTYYQASTEFNRLNDLDGSLPENQLSPMWTYNFTNGGKNAGTYFTDVARILKEIGGVDMAKIPVDTSTGEMQIGNINADKEIFKLASKKRISGYNRISNGDANRFDNSTPITSPKSEALNESKAALNEWHILSASSPGNKWIYNTIEANDQVPANSEFVGQQIVSRCDKPGYAGHRIAIVGYNDDIWVDINENGNVDEGEKGAFKIANSRGIEYGNDGYMWMSYDSLNYISSVYQGGNVDLGYENREPSLIDIIVLNVDVNQTEPEYFIEFDAETSKAAGMSVVVTATKKSNGNLRPYKPAPFKRAMEIGLGEVPFDGSTNVTKGSFAINIGNLITDVNPDNINDYNWIVCVGNFGKDDTPITYSNFKIVDKNGNVVLNGDTDSVTLESGDKYVRFN